jgi:hypothetical protein
LFTLILKQKLSQGLRMQRFTMCSHSW